MGSQYSLFLHYYHVLQRQNLYKMNTPVAESVYNHKYNRATKGLHTYIEILDIL